MIKLYQECLGRDDFDLYVVSDVKSSELDKSKNYLIHHDDGEYSICMQIYKTSKGKYPIIINLSCILSRLLDNYIKKYHIINRLFPSKNGKNTSFISEMNKKINVPGSINTIRHIIISSLSSNMSPMEMVELSKKCFHSVSTQPSYKRIVCNT